MSEVTQEQVKELFDYRDGALYWKKYHASNAKAGEPAGCTRKDGYRIIWCHNKSYLRSRLVWLWHYGKFPNQDIDHINRNTSDDRIENLRDVSRAVNLLNKGSHKGVSGYPGVAWLKARKKWKGAVHHDGTEHRLYYGDSFLAACRAVRKFRKQLVEELIAQSDQQILAEK
jgi:hypothetical protein